MGSYTLSTDAEQDIIYLYSIEKFGLARADEYIDDMEALFSGIAAGTVTGKPCGDVAPGLLQSRYVSHSIYYRQKDDGTFILRILHGRMAPGRHL